MRRLDCFPPRLWQAHDADGSPCLEWRRQPHGLGRMLRTQWVIERSQCLYRCLDLSHVPASGRAQALALKLAGLSPFRLPGHYAVWRDGWVQLWLWDEQQRQRLAEAQQAASGCLCLPETLLQAPPAATPEPSVRLVRVQDGVDLQVWRAGVLRASVFQDGLPLSAMAWQAVRGVPGVRLPERLEEEVPACLERPWASGASLVGRDWERWLPYGLAATLLAGSAFNLTQGAQWWWAERGLAGQQVALALQVEPVLAARTRAMQAESEIQALLRLQDAPSQVELLRTVAGLLPEDSRLLSWRFRENALELLIQTSRADPRFFVQRLQEGGRFQDVRVEPSPRGDGLQLAMNIRQGE